MKIEYGTGNDKREITTLRAENERLRGALEAIVDTASGLDMMYGSEPHFIAQQALNQDKQGEG
jgi:hypothetical protein